MITETKTLETSPITHIPFNVAMQALGCKRDFIYSLVKEKTLTPKYLRGKVYFAVEEINNAFKEKSE